MNNHIDIGQIEKLIEVMAALRDPHGGCPWDLGQSFETIAPYTVEEAYEVADAIERGDLDALAVELGDLLLQVVYHARLAEEVGAFTFADVTRHICEKMIRRHPHVFEASVSAPSAARAAGPTPAETEAPVGRRETHRGGHEEAWEALKRAEKTRTGGDDDSVLADVPLGLPALTRAVKLGRRASRVGFDWPDAAGARAKLAEELAELDEALAAGARDSAAREIGDVLFAVANLCRHLGVDPEQCARGTTRRFETRFRHVERRVRESGRGWARHAPDELDAYWEEAKCSLP